MLAIGRDHSEFGERETLRPISHGIKPFERSESLVVNGPYCLSRNQMYLGMVLILIGIGLLMGSTMPLLIIPVFVWLISTRFISVEERMLTDRFGAIYEDYCKRVRRWL